MVETKQNQKQAEDGQKSLRIVLVTVAILSTVLGLWAHRQMSHSAITMNKAQKSFAKLGKKLGLHACGKASFDWYFKECSALKILCKSSVSRMTGHCLEAQSNRQECKNLSLEKSAAHFTFKYCKDQLKVKSREEKRICSQSYGAIRAYCMHLKKFPRKKGKPST